MRFFSNIALSGCIIALIISVDVYGQSKNCLNKPCAQEFKGKELFNYQLRMDSLYGELNYDYNNDKYHLKPDEEQDEIKIKIKITDINWPKGLKGLELVFRQNEGFLYFSGDRTAASGSAITLKVNLNENPDKVEIPFFMEKNEHVTPLDSLNFSFKVEKPKNVEDKETKEEPPVEPEKQPSTKVVSNSPSEEAEIKDTSYDEPSINNNNLPERQSTGNRAQRKEKVEAPIVDKKTTNSKQKERANSPEENSKKEEPTKSVAKTRENEVPKTKNTGDKTDTENLPPVNKNLLGGLAAGSLILLGFIFISTKRKQAKRKQANEEFLEHRDKKLEDFYAEKAAPKKAEILAKAVNIEEGGNAYEEKTTKSKIKITQIKKIGDKATEYRSGEVLTKHLKERDFFSFAPNSLWADSIVSNIYLHQECVSELEEFLVQQNLKPLDEKEGEIPEIGGVLMGTPFRLQATDTYEVLVEKFVPIQPEHHDLYRLEFSTTSLAKDLGDIQDKYPELILVGWFHTHPGHGLFLSRPDLRIQDTFFKAPYQFAMEIDSLTKRLDTAFFTRMKDGRVNNRNDLKKHTEWFSWRYTKTIITAKTA